MTRESKAATLLSLAMLTLIMLCPTRAHAQSLSTLYSFFGNRSDGYGPTGGLVQDAAGNFYGLLHAGGINFGGVLFKLDTSGNETVLYTFCSQSGPNQDCTDGGGPYGGLETDSAGNLYGTSSFGGAVGYGTVFMFNPKSGVETVLHSFSGVSTGDGSAPQAGVYRDAQGNLYGTTASGGQACSQSPAGCGIAFQIASNGNEIIHHVFTGGSDGAMPDAPLTYDSGFLYGTTPFGGDHGQGVVFVLAATVLHAFSGTPDGGYPFSGGVLIVGNTLYGTTASGGVNGSGAIFKLKSSGGKWHYKLLASVGGNDGAQEPGYGGMIKVGKYLYTTTLNGGIYGQGTILRIDSKGNIKTLYSFTGGNDGAQPQGSLLYSGGYIYGTTFNGGQFGGGTVYRFVP